MAGACVFRVIIRKLGHRQEPGPIVLLEINKNLKVRFHCTILTFGLAVSLRVKRGGKPSFDTEEVAEQWPEFWDEQWASIGHNWVGQAVVPNYHVENDFG